MASIPPEPRHERGGPSYERRIALLAFLTGLPGAAAALLLLLLGDYSAKVQWTLGAVVVVLWWSLAYTLRERAIRPIQTLSNLLAALHEGDYSIRSRAARDDDALGLAMREVNALGQTLRAQRLGALEATALLRKVMEEIEVAVYAFDDQGFLRLVNQAGARLAGSRAERMLGQRAAELGLAELLDGDTPRTVDRVFAGGLGRWEVRSGEFRQGGVPHRLLVISDLSRTLREEERQAWQRLIRVLGHEINNSLAPIKSIAGSLTSLIGRDERPADLEDDMARGLRVIAGRAESLSRFMGAYARLARLPAPRLEPLDVGEWVQRVASLEQRIPIVVEPGPPVTLRADGDQLDQLLINLVRNAVDASLETHGGVHVGWERRDGHVDVWVRDDGPGIAETANLFVPFFTTKPQGTGIGLALSRQIAEAHGGSVTLANRAGARGCEARVRLPA